jgi:S-formylglutathione hydrolase
MQQIGANLCFGGQQLRYQHDSETLNCSMNFSVYLPPQAEQGKVPVLYWLSGLTCTDENFVTKAGAQRYGAEYGIAIVAPDTSPRGEQVPDDANGAWDFGLGAGFYVNATQEPWRRHYQMYDYVVEELPALINAHLPIDAERVAIAGHSMGGHGALTIALKNPGRYRSASAFSPICAPIQCPWGNKALGLYLGDKQRDWQPYDTTVLLRQAQQHTPIRVDQGDADNFLDEQLKPQLLAQASLDSNYPVTIHMREGYDHSYFFIASYIGEHLRFHAQYLF